MKTQKLSGIMQNKISFSRYTPGHLGLYLIGSFSFLYSIFYRGFAKLHIELPFLDFPIFVGEILLVTCFFLLLISLRINKISFNRYHLLVIFYVLWVLIRAAHGYLTFGPLAFRNAALFYYPLFAVFGFYFHERKVFTQPLIYVLVPVMLGALLLGNDDSWYVQRYFQFPYLILIIVLVLNLQKRGWKYAGLIFTILFFPYYKGFAESSMSHFMASVGSLLFVYVSCVFFIFKITKRNRVLFLLLLFLVWAFGVYHYGSRVKLNSFVQINQFKKIYATKELLIARQSENFAFKEIEPRLYDDTKKAVTGTKTKSKASGKKPRPPEKAKGIHWEIVKIAKEIKGIYEEGSGQSGAIKAEYTNVLFRFYIWKDMWDEMKEQKSLWGINFGKPQRSRTLEMLLWANEEWERDGWITPHNSYLHIIYRGGIIGVIFLLTLLTVFIKLIRRFLRLKSLVGILLSSVILYWMMISNFLVILEFPYHAVPFWSLLGMMLAYAYDLENKKDAQKVGLSMGGKSTYVRDMRDF